MKTAEPYYVPKCQSLTASFPGCFHHPNISLTKSDSLLVLSCSCGGFVPIELLCPTCWWPDCDGCLRLPKEMMPPPVLEHPTYVVHFRDVTALSSMPWGLQGPEIYRSYLHMATHLTDRIFFPPACHFSLLMQTAIYLYCTDPTTLSACYLKNNLSVSDMLRLFFICKYFVCMAFCFWCHWVSYP